MRTSRHLFSSEDWFTSERRRREQLERDVFDGDPGAFQIRPSQYTYNPPSAEIKGSCLVLRIEGVNLEADAVKAEIDRTLSSIEMYLKRLESDAAPFNTHLLTTARAAIEERREKLLSNRGLVASLGYRLTERDGEARTFTAPEIRRATPVMPPASTAPYKPEPTLTHDDYGHILSVVESMALVMERSPTAFRTLGEEDLRTQFLMHLNGHYEGQATGETFNYAGKTDILIRSGDKNIFIAECKFWSGPKGLQQTIDQLLGYNSWRDTKTAVLLFNRNRDFSRVLAAIPDAVRAHPNYKGDRQGSTETRFNYRFAHSNDRNRELFLTVVAFDVPGPQPD